MTATKALWKAWLEKRPASHYSLALLLACIGGGCAAPAKLPAIMPENILAFPHGTAGLISGEQGGGLETTMLALGIPYVRFSVDSITSRDLDRATSFVVDENGLEDERIAAILPGLLDRAR